MLLMLGGIVLVSVGCGNLLLCSCIVSLLPFLVLSLIAMTLLVWPLILLFGLLGAFFTRRRIADIVRDVALVPSGWISVPPVVVIAEDVSLWPYSVDVLIKLVTFLSSLHWPSDGCDLGPGGISYVELLILYELQAGERFQFEKAVPRCKRVDRSISVSAVPFGPGIDIRRSCRLLGAMLRALCVLLGGLGRFLLCDIGANHSRLRHIGWVQSGHGLTSRPRETSDILFLDELLFLFGYPPGSGCALLRGILLLRYCTSRFAHKLPTWSLPDSGGVAMLVRFGHGDGLLVRSDPSSSDPGRISDRSGVLRLGRKSVRLRRKTAVHEVFRAQLGGSFSAACLEEIEAWGFICGEDDDAGRRQLHDHLDSGGPVHDRTGIG